MTWLRRIVGQWALLGASSGAVATLIIFIPHWLGFDNLEWSLDAGGFGLSISPLTVVPGLAFGVIVGQALRREGLVPGERYAIYIVAAGLSYFFTVQFTLNVLVNQLDNIVLVGVIAGAFGATLLALASATLIENFRRPRPLIAMILSGAVLGAALFFAIGGDHFFGWFLLFAPWQAGYAAAMATALDD